MADMKKSLATLFDDLTALNPPRRREVPEEVRTVAETSPRCRTGSTPPTHLGC